MMNPPEVSIDPSSFWQNPYPTLKKMRSDTPICLVPELDAILFTKRDDIATCEKNIEVFSSNQPKGLMTTLMGQNMMRKDGDDHRKEREAMFPAMSPRTVRDIWTAKFRKDCSKVLDDLSGKNSFDLVKDFAMPVSGHALRHMTGLTNLTAAEIDAVSQGMIDGVGNYGGDPDIEARCHAATKKIDDAIDARIDDLTRTPDTSILSVLLQADQPMDSIRANVKLAISGGQNEPRDAIAGAAWALLCHPDQMKAVVSGTVTWRAVFEEYARWISPIGMSPREITQDYEWDGKSLPKGKRVFFMFSSANRDEDHFDNGEQFDVHRDTSKAVSFGAGPHFCAGAAASRALIADVALPMLFERFSNLNLAGDVPFGGWAFRGPLQVPVELC